MCVLVNMMTPYVGGVTHSGVCAIPAVRHTWQGAGGVCSSLMRGLRSLARYQPPSGVEDDLGIVEQVGMVPTPNNEHV